jgi:rod shape-determining protein MreC
MRGSGRARLILALLLLTAFTLITLDYRSGGGGPLRRAGNAIFGPIERAVADVTRPIGSFFASLGHLNSYKAQNRRLAQENAQLRQRLRLTDPQRAQLAAAQKLLHLDGQAGFRIVAAQVISFGSSLNFESTATIDVGSRDGVKRNETVIDGDGLVGKTETVGPTTTTILLGNDPEFIAGARLARTQEIGAVYGGGRSPMTFRLLDSQAPMHVGDELVTFASLNDRPFVPEVPIGRITKVVPSAGQLYSTGRVKPFVNYDAIDVVGVVVAVPRTLPRDALVAPSPTPSPTPSPQPSPAGNASPTGSPVPPARRTPSPSGSP